MVSLPSFETPNLAEAAEALTPEQLDLLPFGATALDPQNIVRLRNRTEGELSGFNEAVVGRFFFVDVAPCLDTPYFRGRIEEARRHGRLDISFSSIGDFEDGERELTVRVQSASDGGCWIFIKRG